MNDTIVIIFRTRSDYGYSYLDCGISKIIKSAPIIKGHGQ